LDTHGGVIRSSTATTVSRGGMAMHRRHLPRAGGALRRMLRGWPGDSHAACSDQASSSSAAPDSQRQRPGLSQISQASHGWPTTRPNQSTRRRGEHGGNAGPVPPTTIRNHAPDCLRIKRLGVRIPPSAPSMLRSALRRRPAQIDGTSTRCRPPFPTTVPEPYRDWRAVRRGRRVGRPRLVHRRGHAGALRPST
jgi:hypothetical protein